jgi:hypothetical protein
METKGNERHHQSKGESAEQWGAAIKRCQHRLRRIAGIIGHRKGRAQNKFRKNNVTEMSTVDRSALLADSKWQGKTADWKVGLETGTPQKWG